VKRYHQISTDYLARAEVWAERERPGRDVHWSEHLGMCFTVALGLALAVFIIYLALSLKGGGSLEQALGDALIASAILFALTLVALLLVAWGDFRALLWTVERISDLDLDRDGSVGQTEPLKSILINPRRHPQLTPGSPPEIDPQLLRFKAFCEMTLARQTIVRRECTTWRLTPTGLHGGRRLSRGEWELWRGFFLKAGLLDDKGNLRSYLKWEDYCRAFPDLRLSEGREGWAVDGIPPKLAPPKEGEGGRDDQS